MLNRLLKLYSKSNSNTPLEDFTTEAFAGILENDSETLNKFLDDILNVNKNHYTIETQKHYSLGDGSHAIIDLVLKNQNTICFIENKVESSEGNNQLDKYSRVLDTLSEYPQKYLFYCTKYFDPKEETRHNFRQFRWIDIAGIIKSSENLLTKAFYIFLKNNNMTQKDEIRTTDLFYMGNLKETMSFLDSFLERIRPSFEEIFGKSSSLDNGSQMRKFNRYVFNKSQIFGMGNSNEIGVGFKFEAEPTAYIWIWTSPSNSKSNKFNEYLDEFRDLFHDIDKDSCSFTIELVKFLGKENSLKELENWYRENFQKIKYFIEKTPELDWRIK